MALLAVVVMVNWLASRHYVRFDWTKAGYYQLAGKTKQVLKSLQDPVEVVVFLPPNDRRDYVEKTLDDVRNLLKEFQFYGKEKLHVEYVDPQRDLARAQQLVKQYTLDSPDVIIFASRGHHKYVRLDEMVESVIPRISTNVRATRNLPATSSATTSSCRNGICWRTRRCRRMRARLSSPARARHLQPLN